LRRATRDVGVKTGQSCTLRTAIYPAVARLGDAQTIVGTWLSLVERTLGVGEVASSNLVVPTIYSIIFNWLAANSWSVLAKLTLYVASYWTHFLATD
jgi:hypothetical protein